MVVREKQLLQRKVEMLAQGLETISGEGTAVGCSKVRGVCSCYNYCSNCPEKNLLTPFLPTNNYFACLCVSAVSNHTN